MQLGILTAPFADTPLEQVADYAASAGFEALEIACWPQAGGEKRRYAGTAHLPIEDMTPSRGAEIMGMLTAKGLSVSGLGYYPNPLHADTAHREAVTGHLKKVITAAGMPARDSARMASSRFAGDEARGSIVRASLPSSVVIETATLARPRSAIGPRMSISRVTRWFLVTIATGWLWAASTSST